MKAMVLKHLQNLNDNPNPLIFSDIPIPTPQPHEVLIEINTCGVCHTELDEIEGRTAPTNLPVVLGHQVVGKVIKAGQQVKNLKFGDRVGIGWIFDSCGHCEFCQSGQENLCVNFKATGRDANGGYAEYMTVPEKSAFLLPDVFSNQEAAPLLCAGAIGYRSLHLTNIENGQPLGLTGFGGSGHLVLLMVKYKFPKSPVYVFARSCKEREFARELGSVWSGDTSDTAPEPLQAIIDTTPVWKPVIEALRNLRPGGRLVINAIRKESIDQEYLLNLEYPRHLWLEKEIKSVANVTRKDIREFLQLAAKIPIKPAFEKFALKDANRALFELKTGNIRGSKVLNISDN
jgi:propanol-preferring alcohol dehydrogenase